MLLCDGLGPEPPRQRHRNRTSAARIRKRPKCCCGDGGSGNQAEQPGGIVSNPISYGQSLTTLARVTAAALTTAAMLHTTNALAATGSSSASNSSTGGIALPLGTATPATHELNATQPFGGTGLKFNESGAGLSDHHHHQQHNPDEDWLDNIVWVFKAFVMLLIIIAAICGNLLVIISVMRVRKLRCVYVIFQLLLLLISCEKAIRSTRTPCNSFVICIKLDCQFGRSYEREKNYKALGFLCAIFVNFA